MLAGVPKLDRLNANKYSSNNAPDYILFALATIDNRHPFWDESMTKLSMLTNYQIDDTIHLLNRDPYTSVNLDFILLKKRNKKFKIKEVKSTKLTYRIGDTLHIPKTNNLLYLYADVKYSFYGKLKKYLFQPNIFNADILYEEFSNPIKYRAVIPLLKGGVLVNKRIVWFDDAISFFDLEKVNKGVEYIIFTPKSSELIQTFDLELKEYIIE